MYVWQREPADQIQRLYRVAIADGRRELLKEIAIPGMLNPASLGPLFLTDGARSYIWGYGVDQSDLFLVSGLK